MLHGIGFFISSLRDDELPAPQELVGPDSRLNIVADYLDGGVICERYRGVSWCRFDCGESQMGSCDLTDGVWLWPEGLSHYLRIHSVRLPEVFVAHALAGRPYMGVAEATPIDLHVWTEWSRAQRCDTLRESLRAAQQEDARLAADARQARVDANTAKYGEGERRCLQAGCGRSALMGMVLCAYHLPEMTLDDAFHSHSHRLLSEALRSAS
jgi:hypothetical protein